MDILAPRMLGKRRMPLPPAAFCIFPPKIFFHLQRRPEFTSDFMTNKVRFYFRCTIHWKSFSHFNFEILILGLPLIQASLFTSLFLSPCINHGQKCLPIQEVLEKCLAITPWLTHNCELICTNGKWLWNICIESWQHFSRRGKATKCPTQKGVRPFYICKIF